MFTCETSCNGGVYQILLKGYADQHAAVKLEQIVIRALKDETLLGIVFDFKACKVFNSPCIVKLYELVEMATVEREISVVFSGLDKTKASFFEMFGILEVAEMRETLEEALAYLRS